MGWIVVLVIFIIVLVIWLSQKKGPAHKFSSQPTLTKVPRRPLSRHGKAYKLLQLGFTKRLRLTIKYETFNHLPDEPAIKVRDIDIYGLGSEYFDAYCHYRMAQRTFKISRVLWARLSDVNYQIPLDYVPSGWVTEGWGEIKDAILEKAIQVTPTKLSTSFKPGDTENRYKQKKREHVSGELGAKLGYRDDFHRTYVRYDWKKHFEESIRTPFPDEWSPALPYLHEAYKLEKEGGNEQKMQELLEKAREADSNTTNFYIGRQSIIKKIKHELE